MINVRDVEEQTSRPLSVKRYALLVIAGWTVAIGALGYRSSLVSQTHTLSTARVQALAAIEKDILYRRWISEHGGVYVPVTPQSPPNPYLKIDGRDVTTESGLVLTLINPEYMARQVHELGSNLAGHLASLDLIRPENAPYPWEAELLRKFARGETESVTLVDSEDGEEYLRAMKPLFMEEACLSCHGEQGYQIGDVRGGVSVSVPLAPLQALTYSRDLNAIGALAAIWLLGVGLIVLGFRHIRTRISKQIQAEEGLRDREGFIRAVMDLLPVGVAVNSVDPIVDFHYMNDNFPRFYRTTREELTDPDVFWDAVYEDPAFREQMKTRVLDDCASGNPEQMYWEDVPIARKGEETTFINARNTPVPNEQLTISTVWDVTRRKRAEETLRDTSARLSLAARSSNVGLWDWDLRTDQVYFSPEWKGQIGYEEDEIPSRYEEWENRLHPEDRPRVLDVLQRYMEGTAPEYVVEFRLRHKDGSYRWIATQGEALLDDRQQPYRMLGCHVDITERKQTEGALRESEERYRLLIESIPSVVWVSDHQGRTSYISPNVERVYGYTSQEILDGGPDLWFGRVHPGDVDGVMKEIGSLFADGKPFSSQYRIQRKDGRWIWIHDVARSVQERDGDTYAYGVFLDVTERKQAEEALRESEKYLNKAQEMAHVGHWKLDPETEEITGSDELFRIFGLGRSENTMDDFVGSVHPDDREYDLRHITRGITHGENWDIEHRLICRDGTEKTVRATGEAITDDSGKTVELVGTVHEITESKRMEDEIRRAHNLESLGTLAGGIAHDFNNVLTGVTGNLALLERMVDKDAEEYRMVARAIQSADRTRGLTQQLMAFAKGGAPVKAATSIEALVRDTTGLTLSGSNTNPRYLFGADLLPVDIDSGQIGQVIQNLVLNADQAMPDGGTLEVSADNVEVRQNDPLILAPGHYVKISVEDEGIGMPESVLERIFDPYYTTKPKGHGLGLAIVHTIMSNHGGSISASSKQGVGTKFEIHLPASENEASEEQDKETEPARGSGKILLMDDEETVQTTVGRMLEMLGYRVVFANNGEQALETYGLAMEAEEPFDLVMMDLTIRGGMGGKEAVTKLHQIDPDARVVVSSGYSNDLVMNSPEDYGFLGIVRKPVEIMALAEVVHNAMA